MELQLDLTPTPMTQAVDGMRRPFLRAFGHSPVARRLAAASWPAFRGALLHGSGIALATAHAQVAAEERNLRTMLVARWSRTQITAVVGRAVQSAANAA